MKFKELFGKAVARWIRYSEYDVEKSGEMDEWYITPTKDATAVVYDPIEIIEEIVVDALNIGMKFMSPAKDFYDDNRMVAEMSVFAEKYGLMGFMTALPTTPEFMEYESVYLPKNRHIRKESMPSKEYAKMFFPFGEMNENPNPYRVYPSAEGSLMASLEARRKPRAVEMCYQRGYAESVNWLMAQYKDWALTFMASMLHYELNDPLEVEVHRKAVAVFDGNVPSFHIELLDKPVMVWDFHSLMSVISVVLGLLITEDGKPLRACKYCNRAFIAKHPQAEFCKPSCKNKYNVYKSRENKG